MRYSMRVCPRLPQSCLTAGCLRKTRRKEQEKKAYDAKEGGSLYSTFKEALSNPYRSPQPLLERLQQMTVEMNVKHLQ